MAHDIASLANACARMGARRDNGASYAADHENRIVLMEDVFGLTGQTLLGKYRVEDAIADGGFAVLYRGVQPTLNRRVALKCLKIPSHFTSEARTRFTEQLRSEGTLLSKLSGHPSIVEVFDFGTADTVAGRTPFLAMEWLDGETLQAELAAEREAGAPPLSEREAIALLMPVLDAMTFAHEQGIAHRDLKPGNLFVCNTAAGDTLKVLDFGLAKAMQEGDTVTRAQTNLDNPFRAFAPLYAAPEQFYPKKFGATGPWTDVHAIALILVELVTGQHAYDGTDFAELLHQAIDDTRPSPRTKGAKVSDAFEAACDRALRTSREDRFQNMGELRAALRAIIAETQPSAHAEPTYVCDGCGKLVTSAQALHAEDGRLLCRTCALPRAPAPPMRAAAAPSPPRAYANLRDGKFGTDPTDPFKAAVCPACGQHVTPGSHYCVMCGATDSIYESEAQIAAETHLGKSRLAYLGAAAFHAFFALIAFAAFSLSGSTNDLGVYFALPLAIIAAAMLATFLVSRSRSSLRFPVSVIAAILHLLGVGFVLFPAFHPYTLIAAIALSGPLLYIPAVMRKLQRLRLVEPR